MDQGTLAEVFEYLDDLRESGAVNMFGARPYVADEFGLDKDDSSFALKSWMDSFDGEKTADQRAEEVCGAS